MPGAQEHVRAGPLQVGGLPLSFIYAHTYIYTHEAQIFYLQLIGVCAIDASATVSTTGRESDSVHD